jgi:thymidylate kinase
MTPSPTPFFVLSGHDGSGKSTAIALIRALRPQWSVGSYEPRDWLPDPRLARFDWMLTKHPRELAASLSPAERARFLLDLITAHARHWLEPRLRQGRVVLMDSYIYRFGVKEGLMGDGGEWFVRALDALPRPRAVLHLDLDPGVAWARRPAPRFNEHAGEPTREGFARFQAAVAEGVRAWCQRTGVGWGALPADAPPQEVAGRIVAGVEGALRAPPGTAAAT